MGRLASACTSQQTHGKGCRHHQAAVPHPAGEAGKPQLRLLLSLPAGLSSSCRAPSAAAPPPAAGSRLHKGSASAKIHMFNRSIEGKGCSSSFSCCYTSAIKANRGQRHLSEVQACQRR